MAGQSGQAGPRADELRRPTAAFALAVALFAAVADPSSGADVVLALLPVVAFAVWAFVPRVPLSSVAIGVLVPVVVAQRSGALEPLFFEVSLLAFVVARWSRSRVEAALLGLASVAAPVVVSVIQDPSEIAVGLWVLGIAFPWGIGRAFARQAQLASQLDAARRELAEQTLLAERRRIARDVHDLVGHGLAAVMLQVTSARHVLRRDPAAAEEALRSAEAVGRRSMEELRRTVSLLREDDRDARSPLPSVGEITALVEEARAGGLSVELRLRGDVSGVPASVGVALYRIAQEALANATRHAPRARTLLGLELLDGQVSLTAESNGAPTRAATEPERPRYGVVGMRERAVALGGQLEAGPTADGWRVSCLIPLSGNRVPAVEDRDSSSS